MVNVVRALRIAFSHRNAAGGARAGVTAMKTKWSLACAVAVTALGCALPASADILTIRTAGYIDTSFIFYPLGIPYSSVSTIDVSKGAYTSALPFYTELTGGSNYGLPSLGSTIITIGGISTTITGSVSTDYRGYGIGGTGQEFSTTDLEGGVDFQANEYDTPFPIPADVLRTENGNYCGNPQGDGIVDCLGSIGIFSNGKHVEGLLDIRYFAVTRSVPEPSIWVMMLMGFSGLGAALRSRRRPIATAATG